MQSELEAVLAKMAERRKTVGFGESDREYACLLQAQVARLEGSLRVAYKLVDLGERYDILAALKGEG